MMKTTKELLKNWAIDEIDAIRVVLECLEKLGEDGGSRHELLQRLRRVVDEGVRAVADAERTEAFAVVAWASVEARAARRPTTRRDLRCFVRRMLRVEGVGEMPLRRMTPAVCRHLLQQAFGGSASSYKKGRAILHSIFAFGMRREWCDANPVDRIEVPHIVERPIEPLSIDEVQRLEAAARLPEHRAMLFSLHLMLYCGLRPHEVRRLQPADVHCDEGEVVVRAAVSKTGGGRVVPLRGELPEKVQIPRGWERRWRALRRAAGFAAEQWRADVCRHSFASYHAAYFRDMMALQCEMGHCNQQLLRTRYVSPVSKRHACVYWR